MILAHGVGVIEDLPVPAWLFYYGAALVLIASFVALGVLWTKPRLEDVRERALSPRLERIVLSAWLRRVLGAASFGLLVLVVAAGLLGKDSPALNLAPTFVYVVFWLGVPLLSVLLGNVWSVLNPWRAAADATAFFAGRLHLRWNPPLHFPEALGRWPAAALLAAFVALELAYTDPSSPRTVAVAALLYSWLTWAGAAAFGRRAWFENGDGFSEYFGLFALLAPLTARDGRILVRPPFTGATRLDAHPGTLALVAVVLGSVAFDGLSGTNWWTDLTHTKSDPAAFLLNLAGLLAMFALTALTYLAAVAVARLLQQERRQLAGAFLGSLIPIAFAYVIAHYFSLFVFQGQVAFRLISDPFGFGWNLLGTSDFEPNFRAITPKTTWYVQVGALVVGHVLGLILAHDRALVVFSRLRSALRAQYAMLALMVVYTVGGMWILSRP